MAGAAAIDRTQKIQWLVLIAITGMFFVLPETSFYTHRLASFLAVTVFCIGLLCFGLVDVYVPAVLMPAGYVLLGVADWPAAMSGWTNSLPGILYGAFIISNSLEKCGLIRRLAYFAVLRTRGSYYLLCFAILIVGWIASLITSCNGHMIMIIIGLGICKALGFPKFDMRSAGVFLAVALGTISTEQWQYYPPPMSVLGPALQRVDPSVQIAWIDNILFCWPMAICSLLYLALAIRLFVPKTEKFDLNEIDEKYKSFGPLSADEKKMTILMVIFLGMLLFSTLLKIDIFVPFLLISCLLFFPGINLAGAEEARKIPFFTIVLIGLCMAMGAIASSLGLSNTLSEAILPIFNNIGAFTATAVVWVVCALLNVFLTPIAIYSAFGETFMLLFQKIGLNPHAVMFLSVMGGDAIFLPHEHLFYLIIFSFGMISMKTFILLWSVKLPFYLLFILLVQIPYWKLIGFI